MVNKKHKKNSIYLMASMKVILTIAFVLLLDQFSKSLVLDFLMKYSFGAYKVTNFFNLILVYNYGISFGLFNNHNNATPYIILLSSVLMIWLLVLLYLELKSSHKNKAVRWIPYPVAMIIGGGISNIIDRVRYGAVIDFLDFHVSSMHYPAFNFADACIVIGVFFLALYYVCYGKTHS